MDKSKDEITFLTDTVRKSNSTVYHLYGKHTPHPQASGPVGGVTFERVCNSMIAGSTKKSRDQLVEVSEKQIRGNEDDYCSHCLQASEGYDA